MRAPQTIAFKPFRVSPRALWPAVAYPAPAVAVMCVMAVTLTMAAGGCKKAAPPAAKPPPPTVFFAVPTEQAVQEFEEFTGRTAAVMAVEVRARVSGYLDKVVFEDGTDVKAGDPLFVIDDRIYQAEVARAVAAVEQAKARLARLERQATRSEELFQKKVISEEDYDLGVFDRDEARAALAAAQATLDLARLTLSFTRIASPIDGRISRRMVDPGNLIKADDTPLASIVSDNPIHAYFDIDERTVLRLRRLVQEGRIKASRDTRLEVKVSLADDQEHNHRGVVDFEDNQIDATTGTLRVRLLIDNPERLLSPGLFVRLRFPIGEPALSLLVPEEALGSDQGRRFVYVIDQENKVAARPVDVGVLVDGRRAITRGLSAGERVVVTGLQRLRKNMVVDPRPQSNGVASK